MTAPALVDWPTIESAVRRVACFDPATDAGNLATVDGPTLRDALAALASACVGLDDGAGPDATFDAAARALVSACALASTRADVGAGFGGF